MAPPESSRLSRRSRTVVAVVGIAAAFWMIWVFGINAPHFEEPKPALKTDRGVGLQLSELKAGEEIVVVRVTPRGPPMEFRFRPTPAGVTLIVSELDWENRAPTKLVRVLHARDLTPHEAAGVDAVLAFLRRQRRVPHRMHTTELRIEHVRHDAVIGRETLEEVTLLNEWDAAQRHHLDDPEFMRSLEDAARDAGLTLEDLKRWVTFEMLLAAERER